MTVEWVTLDRSLSSVQASTKLYNQLRVMHGKAGPDDSKEIISFAQGAETKSLPMPDQDIFGQGAALSFSGAASPTYNTDVGGPPQIRQAASDWAERFLGISAKNAFVLQADGRDVLNHSMHIAAFDAVEARAESFMITPDTSWPMIEESARDNHMRVINHTLGRGSLLGSIKQAIPQDFNSSSKATTQTISAVYVNTPHNPTGLNLSGETIRELAQSMPELAPGAMLIVDMPYFAACEQRKEPPYLKTGFEGVLDPASETPWAVAISFSKAFGTAQPGLTVLVCSDNLKQKFQARLARNNGVSYMPEFFESVAKAMNPGNDRNVLEHFDAQRKKYGVNRTMAKGILAGHLGMIDGDPNMTGLFEVSKDLIGSQGQCFDGVTRQIDDTKALVEYLANEAGVVVVDNSVQGRNLIRLAFREDDPAVMQKGLSALAKALQKLGAPTPAQHPAFEEITP